MNRFVIERLLAQASTEEPEAKTKKYIKKKNVVRDSTYHSDVIERERERVYPTRIFGWNAKRNRRNSNKMSHGVRLIIINEWYDTSKLSIIKPSFELPVTSHHTEA